MPATKNLCAQLPIDLHQKISEAREQAGLTTAQYITALITEYFKMKETGGNEIMMTGKNRTLAFKSTKNFSSASRTTWTGRAPGWAVNSPSGSS